MGTVKEGRPLGFFYRDEAGETRAVRLGDDLDASISAMAEFLGEDDRIDINVGVRDEPWPNGIILKNCKIVPQKEPGVYDIAWEETEVFDPDKHKWTEEE
jgi:hypothetical protein